MSDMEIYRQLSRSLESGDSSVRRSGRRVTQQNQISHRDLNSVKAKLRIGVDPNDVAA